ncbi:MAG: very short patch repair endonuclease [Eubacteriaceae bacterium]
MTDVFDKKKRSEIMSKVKSKDTKIEIKVRRWLYNEGIRYRINCKDLPGKPDIAIKKYKIAIFINGCFWHGHENCKNSPLPKSNFEYWDKKIKNNIMRDKNNIDNLKKNGWNVFVLWECDLNANFEVIIKNLHKEVIYIKNKEMINN